MTGAAPTITTLLSQQQLHEALLERHSSWRTFEGRETYVGASETSYCQRAVAFRKLHPDLKHSPEAAGRMLRGQALENEGVQIVRIALKGAVRETGNNQTEIVLEDAPIRVHPDGRILETAFRNVLASGSEIIVLDVNGQMITLKPEDIDGDGTLEIKTGDSHVVRKVKKEGLSATYQGQTQVQMGGRGLKWGLMVFFSSTSLADCVVFFLRFDPEQYEAQKTRARAVMTAVDKIQQGILSEVEGLPEGEPERGYCSSCPAADTCPAMAYMGTTGVEKDLPPDKVLDAEALADEYVELEPEADRFESVKNSLKDLLVDAGVSKTTLPSGRVLSASERKGRTTYDSKLLATKFPDAEAACKRVGDPFHVLTIKEKK